MAIPVKNIRNIVREIGNGVGAPNSMTVVFEKSPQDGRPHVEIIDEMYALISEERGVTLSSSVTSDLDELLYWIFKSITFKMSVEYEIKNRRDGEDIRRVLFQHQVSVLRIISERWAKIRSDEIDEILNGGSFSA
jgi:hypothetical protein